MDSTILQSTSDCGTSTYVIISNLFGLRFARDPDRKGRGLAGVRVTASRDSLMIYIRAKMKSSSEIAKNQIEIWIRIFVQKQS